ncbi:hypothetical protein GCM10010245_91300 [Streptomyces spectabilis]|nr:hypothetical protein GCM10010245_91300 [Streptomyces spectabilis]
MRVALSVKEGRVSSVTLLRRLNNRSRKNETYEVFGEVGRAVRASVLRQMAAEGPVPRGPRGHQPPTPRECPSVRRL